jgi:hypothetical protein
VFKNSERDYSKSDAGCKRFLPQQKTKQETPPSSGTKKAALQTGGFEQTTKSILTTVAS